MSFRHIYFDADKSAQYFIVGETMPTIYYKGGGLFGPFWLPSLLSKFSDSAKVEQTKMKN